MSGYPATGRRRRAPTWSMTLLAWSAAMLLATAACSGGSGEPSKSGGGQSSAGDSPSTSTSGPIADLMAKTTMTDEARGLFLAAEPRIEARADLQRHCRNTSGSHTLGCFLLLRECRTVGGVPSSCSRKTEIHLLRIERPDLADLIYVSASHEMLHAAYEEIPPAERRRLDRELEAALPRLDQCMVASNLGPYATRNPAERLSELHSVLATEFADLPTGLRTHYSRYFFDRLRVVQAHDRTLGGREMEICRLRAQLDQLAAQITAGRQQLQRLRSRGQVQAYNAQVPGFNALVTLHNQVAATHNRRVRDYNQILAELGSTIAGLEQRPTEPSPRA